MFVATMIVVSFSSCIDQDDVDIEYQAGIQISAAHLFDSFTTMGNPTDFEMDGSQKLCLTALVYDKDGDLVLEDYLESDKISAIIDMNPVLPNGEYTLISIASFKSGDYCWEISEKEQLQYLTIKNTLKFSGIFTTLGLSKSQFEVKDKSMALTVDIKPVTSLIGIFYWNNNLGSQSGGYTSIASYVEETIIKLEDHNNKITFKDAEPEFSPLSNGILYELNRNYPLADKTAGRNPTTYTYCAILPTNNICFYPALKFTKKGQTMLNVNEVENGQNTKSLNLESGKQYVMDMLLAGPVLFFGEYDPEEKHENRLNRLIGEYNEEMTAKNLKLLENVVDFNFHVLIGEPKNVVENTLNFKLMQSEDLADVYCMPDNMIGKYAVVKYWDSSKQKAKQVVIMCEGCFTDDKVTMDSFHQYLAKKYVYQENVSNPQVRYYFSSAQFKDTKYVVVLDNTRSYLVFDAPELH